MQTLPKNTKRENTSCFPWYQYILDKKNCQGHYIKGKSQVGMAYEKKCEDPKQDVSKLNSVICKINHYQERVQGWINMWKTNRYFTVFRK